MKKTLKLLLAVLSLLLASSLLFVGCDKDTPDDKSFTEIYESPDYSELELSEYVTLGEYKNIKIAIGNVDVSVTEDILLWESIVAKAEIIEYPPEALSYYEEQSVRRYLHYAEEGNMTYDELLSSLGITQADIEAEAKDYVKADLVKLAIIKAEGLQLTENEKAALFDKYAARFATVYGYSEEYVRQELVNEIYDQMQYDKMMEYLLLNNEIISNYSEEEK